MMITHDSLPAFSYTFNYDDKYEVSRRICEMQRVIEHMYNEIIALDSVIEPYIKHEVNEAILRVYKMLTEYRYIDMSEEEFNSIIAGEAK